MMGCKRSVRMRYVLTDYLETALGQAQYDKLEDASYSGRIPACSGVISFGGSLRECEENLRSTLEDWILVGLKLGHALPVLDGINLNEHPRHEPVDAV